MKYIKICTLLAVVVGTFSCQKPDSSGSAKPVEVQGEYTLTSPDGNVVSHIVIDNKISYDLSVGGVKVIEPSSPALIMGKALAWGSNPSLAKAEAGSISETLKSEFYIKSDVEDNCNYLILDFGPEFSMEFRAYDEGLAYRFINKKEGRTAIVNERAEFKFSGDLPVVCAAAPKTNSADEWQSSFEGQYYYKSIANLLAGTLYQSPMLVECGTKKMVIAESDVLDYPGMFLSRRDGDNAGLYGTFAPYPDQMVPKPGHLTHYNMSYSGNIAVLDGPRSLPWRIICVSDNDAELLSNDMVWRLASPSKIRNTSWICPGLAVWDYWSSWDGKGNSGYSMTNADYRKFIDLAADNGIEYYLIDGGWSDASNTTMTPRSGVDLSALVQYGKSKGVGLLLWCGANHFCAYDMEKVCKTYSAMGIKGFKIDFWEHDNQRMMSLMEDAARMCAKYNLLIDFHGCTKPSGFNRTWPNCVTFEGVRGMEFSVIWPSAYYAMVENNLTYPFIRQLSGPCDLTPGAMVNKKLGEAQKGTQDSEGTRAHQIALFLTTYSPLGCLCDSPSRYNQSEQNKACVSFIGRFPTVWDETVVLDAALGQRIVIARRSGQDWYVAGINGSALREISVPLGFLGGDNWNIEIIRDAEDSDEYPEHFVQESYTLESNSLLLRLASGGGFAAIITKQN